MSTTNPRNRSTPVTPPVPTEELEAMLTRLRLPAIRDRLDALLEEAARQEMNLREALAWLCAAEVARKDQLRMEMALRLARFPYVRTLEAFDFEARSQRPVRRRDGADQCIGQGPGAACPGGPADAIRCRSQQRHDTTPTDKTPIQGPP